MISENREYNAQKLNSNGLVQDQHVKLPKEKKLWFFFSYSSFLILYLVFVLGIAYTYPLKPVCKIEDINFDDGIPAFIHRVKGSTVSLVLNFNNRNPLISYSYDDYLNISMYYYKPDVDALTYFANKTALGFYQHNRKDMKIDFQMHAPVLPGVKELIKNGSGSVYFVVNLVFSVRFNCRVSCTHIGPLLMNLRISYER